MVDSTQNLIRFSIERELAAAIINDDYSGCSDDDISSAEDLFADCFASYGNAYFMTGDRDDNSPSFRLCEVSRVMSDCVDLFIAPTEA